MAAWVAWQDLLGPGIGAVIARAVRYLGRSQRPDGAWVPLWFGNQRVVDQENPTYGTARVLLALRGLEGTETMVEGGDRWLLSAQNADGGWGGSVNCPSSIEETALALESLAESDVDCDRLARGQTWLAEQTAGGAVTPAAPVGLYFAKLWYAEALYPLIFSAAALGACRKGHS